jgi:hypothetical protein
VPNVDVNFREWQEALPALPGARLRSAESRAPARYFSGGWNSLEDLLTSKGLSNSYDLVLTAETIYSLKAISSLLQAVKSCLRRPGGRALIAAKAFYFGVGGGVDAFREEVRKDGVLEVETVLVVEDESIRREILQLQWPCTDKHDKQPV